VLVLRFSSYVPPHAVQNVSLQLDVTRLASSVEAHRRFHARASLTSRRSDEERGAIEHAAVEARTKIDELEKELSESSARFSKELVGLEEQVVRAEAHAKSIASRAREAEVTATRRLRAVQRELDTVRVERDNLARAMREHSQLPPTPSPLPAAPSMDLEKSGGERESGLGVTVSISHGRSPAPPAIQTPRHRPRSTLRAVPPSPIAIAAVAPTATATHPPTPDVGWRSLVSSLRQELRVKDDQLDALRDQVGGWVGGWVCVNE
jgi:hypothetical protein